MESLTTNYRLDKAFGPVGSVSGIIIFIVGLFLLFTSVAGLIFILLGAFVGFSTTSTIVDYNNRKIKFSNNIFGFIPTGKWIPIEPSMKIDIKKTNKVWRTYSKSNRTLDVVDKDFRLILQDSEGKYLMPIKKTDSYDSAKIELEKLSNQLGLSKV